MELTVDADRLWADIQDNGAFGELSTETGTGRTVLTGSKANRRARDRLVDRLEDAGCTVRIDAVGNIAGRWVAPGVDETAPAVATGSHLDSVPRGGFFDGPLGVYGGLEALRAIQESDVAVGRPIEVVSFTEEEGASFGSGLLGSAVATGLTSPEAAAALTDGDGRTLGTALEEMGYRGTAAIDAGGWDAWLELHIEQARRLERADVPVGVVTDVTGIAHLEVSIQGTADHAGATPMTERRDALAAASEAVLAVEAAAQDHPSETAVGTVGHVEVDPNATNVVPGAVTLGIDIRDIDRSAMDALRSSLEETLAGLEADRSVRTALDVELDLDPTPMAERCRDACHRGSSSMGLDAPDLHSGAAHDTMHVAGVTDGGMLFARSEDGVSHSPAEWTTPEDCAAATGVLARAIATLAGAHSTDRGNG